MPSEPQARSFRCGGVEYAATVVLRQYNGATVVITTADRTTVMVGSLDHGSMWCDWTSPDLTIRQGRALLRACAARWYVAAEFYPEE